MQSLVHNQSASPSPEPSQRVSKQAKILDNILNIVEKEFRRGNQTITEEKYTAFLKLRGRQTERHLKSTPIAANAHPSLYHKFILPPERQVTAEVVLLRKIEKPWTFQRVESQFISVLETIANILDNLNLILRMPMFPKSLSRVLKNTNQIWVLILLFLIRKTISQLLNLRRKEVKIQAELAILRSSANFKLLEDDKASSNETIFRKYEKIIKDLSFDKMMLKVELVGNFLDLVFNAIELKKWPVPEWFMSLLNMASMAMTIYRMNKDDEYTDDDITEDLI